ncbi:hypothetical protein MTR67_026545 [Solanum verrucosum]|uniref:Uncharacterized protein n=1 Tax=Solanum verrucosum TaxID=315347 RepID=A0AAF0TZ87_SOLVR|nr:hypothetical protein MTR67_026545 [Solanum verrucosum]
MPIMITCVGIIIR